MNKEIKKIKCGLFTNTKDCKTYCLRDGSHCEAYNKKKVKDIKCFTILSQLNNLDRILFNRGKLKIKMVNVNFDEIYAVQYYEEIINE